MRILHIVTNADLGGAPRVVMELAHAAVQAGHSCGVASTKEGPLWAHLDTRVQALPLKHIRRNISPIRDFANLLEIYRLYRSWKPDIVHLHSSKMGILGRLAARLPGNRSLWQRTLYTIHGFDTILKAHPIFLPLERFLAPRCAAVVPVSAYDLANLQAQKFKGWFPLVENGVSDRSLASEAELASSPAGKRALILMHSSREKGFPVLLSIARVAPQKRVDLFLDIAKAMPQAHFFWIGNSPDTDLSPFGALPPNFFFLGEIPEAGNFTPLCDIFLLTSNYEGLPMSILEALSAGRPVIASDVGGVSTAVDEGLGACLPNEVGPFVAAIQALLGNKKALQQAGKKARQRWVERFSAQNMWQAYENIYNALLSQKTSKSGPKADASRLAIQKGEL